MNCCPRLFARVTRSISLCGMGRPAWSVTITVTGRDTMNETCSTVVPGDSVISRGN